MSVAFVLELTVYAFMTAYFNTGLPRGCKRFAPPGWEPLLSPYLDGVVQLFIEVMGILVSNQGKSWRSQGDFKFDLLWELSTVVL